MKELTKSKIIRRETLNNPLELLDCEKEIEKKIRNSKKYKMLAKGMNAAILKFFPVREFPLIHHLICKKIVVGETPTTDDLADQIVDMLVKGEIPYLAFNNLVECKIVFNPIIYDIELEGQSLERFKEKAFPVIDRCLKSKDSSDTLIQECGGVLMIKDYAIATISNIWNHYCSYRKQMSPGI